MILERKCKCGTKYRKKPYESYKEWNNRKFCSRKCFIKFHKDSVETRKKKAHHLENHPFWKENCIKTTRTLIKLLKQNGRNVLICEKCQCNFNKETRHIHHKDKDRTNNNQKNLIICCVKCHKRLEGYGKYTDYAKKNKISVGTAWERLNKDKIKDKKRANAKRYYEAHKEEVLKKAHFRYKKQLGLTK